MFNANQNIVVTGTLGYDYIMNFPGYFADRIMPDKIHQISLSFLVNKLSKQFGGTAGNVAYTLNLLGVRPTLLSAAGNDFGPYKQFLSGHKIDTSHISIHADESTGSYFVITDQDDNQIGSFYSGATKYSPGLSLTSIKKSIDFVVISPTDPKAMLKIVTESKKQKLPYLFDPAFQIDSFTLPQLNSAIAGCRILIGNDYEIALIEKKLAISHSELVSWVPILITTLGSKGSLIETPEEKFTIRSAKPLNTSDPTGAGDAYRGGFLAGYLRKFDLQTCGQMGALAAVYTVEKYGTITHKYTIAEFESRYKKNYNQQLHLTK